MTEELYEAKSLEQSSAAGKLDSDNQEVKEQPANAHAGELPQISKVSPPAADDDKGSLRDQKYSTSIAAPESLASEFSFPKSEKSLEDFSGRAADEASIHRLQQYVPTVNQIEHALRNTSPSYSGKSALLSGSFSSLELPVVPQETSSSLGSVLEALQRAKLSLSEKLSSSPQVAEGKSGNVAQPPNVYTNTMDGFQIPFGTPGLFRLPTDYEFEATARVNPGIGVRPSLTNIPYEYAADRFLTVPYVEPRSSVSGDPFRTASRRSLSPETRSAAAPPHRFLSQPWLRDPSPSTSTNHLNPLVPPSQELYPFSPHISVPNIPSNEEEISRTLLSSERGLPPFMRLSSYDGHAGPSMYR